MKFAQILFGSYKKVINDLKSKRLPVTILPQDIVIKCVKGSGPGGQAVNKTNNAVNILHTPTGIQVTSHKTRYMEANKKYAMKLLTQKLDNIINGDSSLEALKVYELKAKKIKKSQKSRKKYQAIEKDSGGGGTCFILNL